jgi:hypothetical protein
VSGRRKGGASRRSEASGVVFGSIFALFHIILHFSGIFNIFALFWILHFFHHLRFFDILHFLLLIFSAFLHFLDFIYLFLIFYIFCTFSFLHFFIIFLHIFQLHVKSGLKAVGAPGRPPRTRSSARATGNDFWPGLRLPEHAPLPMWA